MLEIVPLTPQLLAAIEPQPMQQRLPDDQVFALGTTSAYAALVGGKPIAAAGVVELWPGRGHAWAVLGVEAKRYMLPITRAIRRALDALPFARVEMAVDAGFPQAVQWAFMLGFECETPEPMRQYINGRSAYLFARVQCNSSR